MKLLLRLLAGLKALLGGMGVTFRHMLRKPVTQRYPHEKPVMSTGYRSAIKLINFEETNSHDCVACLQCEKICPSFCIKIDGEKVDGLKKKRATVFEMDFALCSLCGLCLDVCPTTTLEYSKIYDVVGYTPTEFNFDLLEEFTGREEQFREEQRAREAAAKAAKDAAKKAKAEAKAKAKAEAEKKAAEETSSTPDEEGATP